MRFLGVKLGVRRWSRTVHYILILNNKIFKIKDTIKNNKDLTNSEKNELQNKVNELTRQKNSINNEYRRSVNKIKDLKKEKK